MEDESHMNPNEISADDLKKIEILYDISYDLFIKCFHFNIICVFSYQFVYFAWVSHCERFKGGKESIKDIAFDVIYPSTFLLS